MNPLGDLVGESPGLATVRDTITRLLQRHSDTRRLPPILLQGETGTGKGLAARAIYRAGPRADGPFVDVNCAAIPETLLEAEMFGFERGAFTDARQAKRGLFQAAHRGTIFLDEVGLLPEALQGKLLKVIEEKEVRRLGSTRTEPVDIWILTATSEDLLAATRERRFREDLYHRLAVLTLRLPPLRERGGDILILAERFLARACADYDLPPKTLRSDARAALLGYPWPGNVRELINVMERVALLGEDSEVTAEALGLPVPVHADATGGGPALDDAVSGVERAHLLDALRQTRWNISQAATRLGIPRNTLRYRIEKHGLRPEGTATARPRGAAPAASPPPAPPAAAAPVTGAPASSPPPAAAPPAVVRWERRRVTLLRVLLIPVGEDAVDADRSRPLALVVEKVQTFGGRVVELGRSGLVAAFGLDPVEDAATRAGHAALAILRAAARGWEESGPTCAVAGVLHGDQFLLGRLGARVEIDQDAKRPAWEVLDALLEQAEPGSVLVSPAAAPAFERRFDLVPVVLARPPERGYRLQKLERPGFGRRMVEFVGRQQELGLLRSLFASAARGQGQVAGIVGEAGIGKSRLLFEFRQSLGEQPVTYLEGHCVSYGTANPYLPVLDLLRANCGIVDLDSPEVIGAKVRAALAGVGMNPEEGAPYLLHLLGVKEGTGLLDGLGPDVINGRTFETLRQMSLRGSRRRPIVLVVEDLHWIDRTSEEYLASLVESFAAAPILCVATYRPGYRPPWIEKSYTTQIALRPLALSDSLSLVRAVLGGGGVGAAVVDLILGKGEGNPFFLEELARTVREQGGSSPNLAVPDTVEEVILARIDRLSPEGRHLLQAAAVIGKDAPSLLLRAIADLSEEALRRAMRDLQAVEFMSETSLGPETVHTFKHALTHEVAYGSLPPKDRQTLDARIVEAIERLYAGRLAEQVERLAHHAFRARAWPRAVGYLRQAGQKAFARSAHREAVTCFEQALEALGHLPETTETRELAIDLRFDLRNTLHPIGEFGRIIEYLRQAQGLAETMGDRPRLGRTFAYMTQAFWWTGDPDRAIESGQRALRIATEVGDVGLEVITDFYLGVVYHSLGEYRRALDVLGAGVELLTGDLVHERFGLPGLPSVFYRIWLIQCLAERGEFVEGLVRGQEGLRIAEAVEHPFSLIQVYFGIGFLHLRRGDLEEAIPVLERGLELCGVWNIPIWSPRIAATLGAAYALSGRITEAVRLLELAVSQTASLGTMAGHLLAVAWLSEACLLGGRRDDATRLAESVLARSREHKEQGHEAWARWLLGRIHSEEDPGDLAAAEASYRQAATLAEALEMRPLLGHCHLGLGKLYGRRGARAKAHDHLARAATLFDAMGMRRWLEETEAVRARLV